MPAQRRYAAGTARARARHAHLQRRRLAAAATVAAVVVLVTLVLLSSARPPSGRRRIPPLRDLAASLRRPRKPPPLLPRGGRTIFPGHRVVAYYGIIGTSNILGQTGDPETDAAGVERQARAYARFGRPVQPAFELVTTLVTPAPGADGSYSSTIAAATVRRYLNTAHRHKLLLILDFQPGRGEFLPEVRHYERFLLDPSVGVALDPEWKLTAEEVPDQVIGSASAASINAVSAYLARLIAMHRLPQKLFIIHEFRTTELPDRQIIAARHGLATVLQMDGLGPVSTKLDSYRAVMRGSGRFHPGFKVFLRPVDDPVPMTPSQIMALRPRPDYVSYQ